MPWSETNAMEQRVQFIQDWLKRTHSVSEQSWPRESERHDKWTLCFVTVPGGRAQQESRA